MKIGIDIDGVILDSERGIRFYADYWSYFTLNKDRIKNDEVMQEKCFNWNDDETNYFFDNFFHDITINSNIMVGAKEILAKLKDEGHQLYIITLRGYYREQEKIDAEEKLKELGIEFDEVCWSAKNKVEKCREIGIDVMIDDTPDNVEQFANEKIQVLYFKEQPVREINQDNVFKVASWMDIYREIKHLSNR